MKKTRLIFLTVISTLALAAVFCSIFNYINTPLPVKDFVKTPPKNVALANPASSNCLEKGGRLVIETKEDGSQYGLCFFEDNRACEEWAMFRGECPLGGVKTTGYDTMAQKFCAYSGGQTLAVDNAVCTFSDGSTCLAEDFYTGTCQKGTMID